MIHYSLVKGVYLKRWRKGFIQSVDTLSFACFFVLLSFYFILLIDKQFLWEIIRKRMPLGPMVKGILLLIVPILFILHSRKINAEKIKIIRKVIQLKKGIGRIYSILYISIFVILFLLSFFIIFKSRTLNAG
jgi:hypothetical protein